jgi:hypothetical protein
LGAPTFLADVTSFGFSHSDKIIAKFGGKDKNNCSLATGRFVPDTQIIAVLNEH